MTDAATRSRAAELARQILEDFRGAGFYADPKVLAGMIKFEGQSQEDNEQRAIELIRMLLRAYGRDEGSQERVMKELTSFLGG